MSLDFHPLSAGSFRVLLKFFFSYGVDREFFLRYLSLLCLSLATWPARRAGRLYFSHALTGDALEHPPIFIVGHWRSGTTYLHNLLSQDAQFGYVSLIQTLAPEVDIQRQPLMRWLITKNLPKTRPQDRMGLALEEPQEEEISLSNLSLMSFYYGFYLPRYRRELFDQTVLFSSGCPQEKEDWQRTYRYVLQRASFEAKGKPLLLKNPANTARIAALLELFPDAKFIHIYRNPYDVFFSTRNMYQKFAEQYGLQRPDPRILEQDIFYIYRRLMETFFHEKTQIPTRNLVEVQYEALASDTLTEIEKIYRHLELPGFPEARSSLISYIESQSCYRKNRFHSDNDILTRIYQQLSFTIDLWNYEPRTVIGPSHTDLTSFEVPIA